MTLKHALILLPILSIGGALFGTPIPCYVGIAFVFSEVVDILRPVKGHL